MADIRVAFGRAVRRLRLAKGLAQESFAAQAKVGRSYMGKIERGEVNVSLENIHKIARGLGITIGHLMMAVDSEMK